MSNPNTERTPIIDKNGKPTHVHKKVATAPKPSGRLPGIPSAPVVNVKHAEQRRSELLDLVAFYADGIDQIEEDIALLNSKIDHPSSSDASGDEFRREIVAKSGTMSGYRTKIYHARTELFYLDQFDFYTEPKTNRTSLCAAFDEDGAIVAFMDGTQPSTSAHIDTDGVSRLKDFFANVQSGAHVAPSWEAPSEVMESLNDLQGELTAVRQSVELVVASDPFDSERYASLATQVQDIRGAMYRDRAKLIAGEKGFDHMVFTDGTDSWNRHSAIGFTMNDDGSASAVLISEGRETIDVQISEAEVGRLTSHLTTS